MISSTWGAMTTYPVSCADERLVHRIRRNLDEIRERIESCSPHPERVRIVAVTKTFGPEYVNAVVAAGMHDVGENYVDELCEKRTSVTLPVTWRYLGALQTNKISRLARVADVIEGVSRERELSKLASLEACPPFYVQVDVTGLQGRNGASPEEVPHLVNLARELNLPVRGLMTVADPHAVGDAFLTTRRLADELSLVERSMGMSDDYVEACRAGSTEIRLGRALLGPRVMNAALT